MTVKTVLSEKIAGEITLSHKPGQTIRKWRDIFQVSQTELAQSLSVSPSVVCDYESGRRKSPGILTIRKMVEALLEIDEKKNDAKILRRYKSFSNYRDEGVLEIMEYPYGIPTQKFIDEINGDLLTSPETLDNRKDVNGFTLIDGVKAISEMDASNYAHLYGWSTDRALVFTGIKYGRSPMIAIRVHPVKPALVVYHKPSSIDPLAVNLAEREKIPLVVTVLSLTDLRRKLVILRTEEE